MNRPIVRKAMRTARMRRADLAEQTGIEPRTLTNALGANHQTLDDIKIDAICAALSLKYEDVIADESPDPDPPRAVEASASAGIAASVSSS